MKEFNKYVGLDVQKDTISVSIADAGLSKARYYGTIKNTSAAVPLRGRSFSVPLGCVTDNEW